MTYLTTLRTFLYHRQTLWLLFIVNALGTLYGYYWYIPQLERTEWYFLPFVPDSPTASLFFTLALLGWLLHKEWKWVEALAFITLIKYGIWAVVMNFLTLAQGYSLGFVGWMLIISHGLMAVQALLYWRAYHFTWLHFIVAAVWTLHNDVIDYVFGQMPVYFSLMDHLPQIGYFTFWLSMTVLALAGWNIVWRKRQECNDCLLEQNAIK